MKYPDPEQFTAALTTTASASLPEGLSQLERSAVLASVTDGPASLSDPTWSDKLARAVFGIARENGLASARLEALRRYAVEWRLLAAVDGGTLGRVRAAGFSEFQLHEVRTLVRPERRQRKSRHSWIWLAVAAAVAIWGFAQVRRVLGDPMISAIVLAVIAMQLVPLLFITSHAASGASKDRMRRGAA